MRIGCGLTTGLGGRCGGWYRWLAMATKKKKSGFDFVKAYLTKKPKAAYADVRAAAEKAGFKIFPIVYGRAKALLGLVPSKPRGSGKAARAKKAAARKAAPAPAPRKRGRPAKAATTAKASVSDVGSLVAAVREMQADRARMRAALAKIRDVIDAAL